MNGTTLVVVAARTVRVTAMICVAGLLVGYIAVASFASRYGASTPMALDNKSDQTALSTAVAAQEAAGLTCSEKPSLTDVVLFQRDGDNRVTILTFDQAIKASG